MLSEYRLEQFVIKIVEIKREPDFAATYLHFTGGFRAAKLSEDKWRIEPVFIDKKPCTTGPLTENQLKILTKKNKFSVIAFQKWSYMDGVYHSAWTPIVHGKNNHSEGPAELWSNIAGNIAREREFFPTSNNQPTEQEIAKTFDNRDTVEALARHISFSFRSMDISVEKIAEHYHEQLVNHMAAGHTKGEKSTNMLSLTLYAHVHSFFLHLGAARDYLGALIAHRIGLDVSKIDSMARLTEKLSGATPLNDPLLELLVAGGDIATHSNKPGKFVFAGWMKEATDIRNEFVHKRPYGSKYNEIFGWIIPTQTEAGHYRYFHPLDLNGNAQRDVFDMLHYHYSRCTTLLYRAAEKSGYNVAMLHITDSDVISVNIREHG
jgi:hypothetical protein